MTQPRWPLSLKQLPLFRDCTRAELHRIGSLLTSVEVGRGEVLVAEGGHGNQVLIISRGEAEVTRGSGRDRQVLATIGAGDVVGELALLGRAPRSATVTSLTPMTILAANTREFFALLEVPSVAAKIRDVAEARRAANASVALAA